MDLATPLTEIKGVGPARASLARPGRPGRRPQPGRSAPVVARPSRATGRGRDHDDDDLEDDADAPEHDAGHRHPATALRASGPLDLRPGDEAEDQGQHGEQEAHQHQDGRYADDAEDQRGDGKAVGGGSVLGCRCLCPWTRRGRAGRPPTRT